jgi:hypothetical protein
MPRVPSLFLVLAILAAPSAAQIVDGSFEASTPGGAPGSPWTTSAGATVFPGGSCFFELAMPTQGSNWAELSNSGTSTVDPLDPNSYRNSSNSLSQAFSWAAGSPILTLDVQLKTGESPSPTTPYNDFCIVEVQQGSSWVTLASLTVNASSFPGTSVCGTDPITSVQNLNLDLSSAFAGSTSSTVFTLWIFCGNAGDGAVASAAYIDNVAVGGGGPTAPLTIDIVPVPAMGASWFELQTLSTTLSNVQVRNFLSLVQTTPTGSGGWFGLAFTIDVIDQALQPIGAEPFNVALDANGSYSFGPFFFPASISLDAVAVAQNPLTGEILYVSPVNAITL